MNQLSVTHKLYKKRLENYYSDIINSYEPAREIFVLIVFNAESHFWTYMRSYLVGLDA